MLRKSDGSVILRVCLIGATHPCHNPRLLREADSLAEAGHDVRVVTPSYMIELDQIDRRQLARRKWRHQKIVFLPLGWYGKYRSFMMRGRRRLAQMIFNRFGGRRVGEYAYTTALSEQIKMACCEPADWFIAHAHAALPVATAAAARWSARLAFDCEDLLAENNTDPVELVRAIERNYLHDCDYVSVPSKNIACRLEEQYGIRTPLVLYNVFPVSLAEGMLAPSGRPANPALRLHWFSQTVGPGRGLEEAIEAVGMLDGAVELHLRGNPSMGYSSVLTDLARGRGVSLKFHPQVDHDDLIRTLGQFDVGLALERSNNGNTSRTLSNKIGSYLLAGLAVAATDTPGQREVLGQLPATGFLYPAGQPARLAEGLRNWLSDRTSLRAAQQAAWDAAREKYCWDIEQKKFLQELEKFDRVN